jgi:uncharacterized protein YjbI with pentapeptide repeats
MKRTTFTKTMKNHETWLKNKENWQNRAIFEDADFENQTLMNLDLREANFDRCLMSNAIFQNCNLDDTKFVDCCLEDVRFINCSMQDTTISGSELTYTKFSNCDVTEINFFKNSYNNTNFSEAKIDWPTLRKVDEEEVVLNAEQRTEMLEKATNHYENLFKTKKSAAKKSQSVKKIKVKLVETRNGEPVIMRILVNHIVHYKSYPSDNPLTRMSLSNDKIIDIQHPIDEIDDMLDSIN